MRCTLLLVLLASACAHPVMVALDRGDAVGACDAFWKDRRSLLLPAPIPRRLGETLRAATEVAWQIDSVPHRALADGQRLTRVTLSAKALPAGATIHVRPPSLWEGTTAADLRPYRKAPAPKAWDWAVPAVPALQLETIPPEHMPRAFVERGPAGHWRYRAGHDAEKMAFMLMTGGLSLLLPDRKDEYVPPSKSERAAWSKQQAIERRAFEAEEAARVAKSREVIEAVTERNRARTAEHQQRVAERSALLDELVASLVLPQSCTLDDRGAIVLRTGQTCSYLTEWATGDKLLRNEHEVHGRAELRLANDCQWPLVASYKIPGPLWWKPTAEIFTALFAQPQTMPLVDDPIVSGMP